MNDPVVTCDGHTYERTAVEEWLQSHDTSPITNEQLDSKALIPNILLRSQIQAFKDANPQHKSGGSARSGAAASANVPVSRRRSVNLGAHAPISVATPSPRPAAPASAAASTSASSSSGGDRSGPGQAREVSFVKGRPIGLDLDDFLCVRSVHLDSQGHANHIARFEAITQINGSPVLSVPELRQAMSRIPNAAQMSMTLVPPYVKVLRKGIPFGMSLTANMLVQAVLPGTQAAAKGILVRSRLVAVDDVSVTFSELAAALGPKAGGADIDFTFVPPVGPSSSSSSAPPSSSYAPAASPSSSSSSHQPPPPPSQPTTSRSVVSRSGNRSASGASSSSTTPRVQLTHGEGHDVVLVHRQLGFSVHQDPSDEGFLRIADVRPGAKSVGVHDGSLVLFCAGKPLARETNANNVDAFAGLVEEADRPLTLKLFRCHNFSGAPRIPTAMLLSGYLLKKSRTGSTFRPWGERLVEIKGEGFLTYKAEKKSKQSSAVRSPEGPGGSGDGGVDGDAPDEATSVSLLNCTVLPLSRSRAGRDFAFEVMPANKPPGSSGAMGSPNTGGKRSEKGPESLTLAANSAGEGAQWIKAIQAAATFYTEAVGKRTKTQQGEVADAIQLQTVLTNAAAEEENKHVEEEKLAAAAKAASLAQENEAKARKDAAEEEELQRAMQESSTSFSAHQSRVLEDEATDRKSMLQALLLSSDMYAQELHGTAEEQRTRSQWRLAYDSYKLAVSFYLKATAIADELERDPAYCDEATLNRIHSDTEAAMQSADECFLKSHTDKKKKRKTERGSKKMKAAAMAGTEGAADDGGDANPSTPKPAKHRASSSVDSAGSEGGPDWYQAVDTGSQLGANGLPAGWDAFETDDGIPYYHHETSGETVWEKPTLAGAGGEAGVNLDALAEKGDQGDDGDDESSDSSSSSDDDDEVGSARPRHQRRKTAKPTKEDDDAFSSLRGMVALALPTFGDDDYDDKKKKKGKANRRQSTGFSDFISGVLDQDKELEGGSSDDDSSSSGSESSFDEEEDDFDRRSSSGTPSSLSSSGASARPSMHKQGSAMEMRASEGETKGRVLMELIESERRYEVILGKICHVSSWLLGEKKAVKPKDHEVIFAGANQLLDLSQGFLKDIDDELNSVGGNEIVYLEDVQIGKVLNKYMPFFKIYTMYSDSYDEKQAKLKELVGDGSTDFAKYLRAAMEDKEVSGDFQSLLIQPIQRLPRYKMLLERMVQNIERTTPNDPDLPLLKKAFETVSGVAMHINQSLRRQVEQLKLLELQSCFFPPVTFVAPGRRLIKKGELDKIADKNNSKQKYVFFLFNDALAYGAKLFGGYYRFHRMIKMTDFDELTMTDHTTNRFRIMAEERNLTLQAKSYDEKQAWVKAITEKMQGKNEAEATFVRARSASQEYVPPAAGAGAATAGFDWQSTSAADRRNAESPERAEESIRERMKKRSSIKGGNAAVSTNTF